jgi:hypothetical protein
VLGMCTNNPNTYFGARMFPLLSILVDDVLEMKFHVAMACTLITKKKKKTIPTLV